MEGFMKQHVMALTAAVVLAAAGQAFAARSEVVCYDRPMSGSRSDMERAGARLVQVPGVSGKQYESPDPDAGWKPDVANMLRIQADMASMRTCVQDVGMAQQLAYHDALVSELR